MRCATQTLLGLSLSAAVAATLLVAAPRFATAQDKAAAAAAADKSSADKSSTAAAPAAGAPASGDNADPQALLTKGDAALKSGDFAAAINAYNDAFKAAQSATGDALKDTLKQQTAAIIGRGRALMGAKEYDAAEKDFKSILQDDPQNVSALVALGQLKIETGKPDDIQDALDAFQKAVKGDSSNIDAQFGYGKVLELLGRADEAVQPLAHVVAADPKNAEAYRLLGTAYGAQYKTKQAIDDLNKAIELNPDDSESYFSLGALDMRLENYKGAVDEIEKAISHYKPKPGQEDQPYYQGYLTRAAAFLELGKAAKDPAEQKTAYQNALDETKKLIAMLDSKNPTQAKGLAAALFSRGVAERMLGQYGPAIRTFTQAIELRTNAAADDSTSAFLSDVYFRRGICFFEIGEEKMAISDFEASAHLNTDDPRANLWEGFTYAKLGEYQQALRAYGDAIAASDRYTPAYFNRALTYMMIGDYKKAVNDFNEAIRLEPANADYYFKRGLAYEALGDNQKAAESYASAIQFDDKHEGAHRHMADVQQALGHTELANQYRQKAAALATPQKTP